MPKSPGKKKIRLNLELTESVKGQLDELQERSDAASLTEVIRKALALYNMVIDHTDEGGSLILRSEDSSEKVVQLL